MRFLLLSAALCLATGKPTYILAADVSPGARSVAGWEAVGRLNLAERAICTGALIAPDMVLTAAHCLFDPVHGGRFEPRAIRFDAGLNRGHAKASRRISAVFVHPDYVHRKGGKAQVGNDLAVLRLDHPISARKIKPFATDTRLQRGDSLSVISYTRRNVNSPTLQQPCQVLARKKNTVVMNCEMDIGASGAPVFIVKGGATPRLVSVVSSRAEMGNRAVSIGAILDRALKVLWKRAG